MTTSQRELTRIQIACLLRVTASHDIPEARALALQSVPREPGTSCLIFEMLKGSMGETLHSRVFRAVIEEVNEGTGDVIVTNVYEMFYAPSGDLGLKNDQHLSRAFMIDDIGDPSDGRRYVEIRGYGSGLFLARQLLQLKAEVDKQRTELDDLRRILNGWPIPLALLRFAEFLTPHRLELLTQLISRAEKAGSSR